MKKTPLLILLLFLFSKSVHAQDPYVGEIRIFAGNFAPYGWMFCEGQLLPISEYETLFNLIGTTYGGDGQSTFALPDLRGRLPIGTGQRPGGSNFTLGQMSGAESVTLTTANMPSHQHNSQLMVNNGNATVNVPSSNSSIANSGTLSGRPFMPDLSYSNASTDVLLDTGVTANTGSSQPISIMKPYLGVNYIISLYGIYPTQN